MQPRRICLYTAIYGRYDTLKPVPQQDVPCDLVCFTDEPAIANPGQWKIVHAPLLPDRHPRMRARFFKTLHHQVFKHGRLAWNRSWPQRLFQGRYDYTIWIDGSIQVKSPSFAREFTQHIAGNGWSMFVHPDRSCIYAEAEFSKTMPKYFDQPISEQVEAYRAEGYPENAGLLATGLIARSTGADLRSVEKMWWNENLRWSYQDQLSLPVVLWRLRRSHDPVRTHLWSNEWFDWIPHLSDR